MSKTKKDKVVSAPAPQTNAPIALESALSKKNAPKFIYILIVLAIAIVGTISGVLAWYFSSPSIEKTFISIEKNNNYAYTAYVSRPTTSNQIVHIKNTHNKRYVDTGINQFVVDYSVSSENVGLYTEINNVWIYEEVFRGDEGTGLKDDNRALKAFDIAVEDLNENFEINKDTKRYELKASSYHKVYANSLGGSCEIYRLGGDIYVDAFYGLDGNNKERIVITKVGSVKIKIPALTNMNL